MVNSENNPTTTHPKSVPDFMSDFPHSKDPKICKLAEKFANRLIDAECEEKEFVIDSGRPCPKTGEAAKVDLVVVIDTSGSMSDEAGTLSDVAEAALQAAQESCPSNLRVIWLGIEDTFADTNFNTTVREYLKANGINPNIPGPVLDSDLVGRQVSVVGEMAQEDGAAAIQDIVEHFDWREGTSRNIFFLGDEGLEGGGDQTPADTIAANAAIAAATTPIPPDNVVVHMYAGTGISAEVSASYLQVANATDGRFFDAAANGIDDFEDVLTEVICSGTQVCKPADIPELAPCFKIHWGDGPKDMIETTDTECLCITACNRYSNVTFKDLTIVISVLTKADGTPVPDLPDGTPSVYVKPSKFICFGDLPPCDPHKPDELSCISRELVLVSCGAMEGKYWLKIGYCYSVHFDLKGVDKFKLPLCAS